MAWYSLHNIPKKYVTIIFHLCILVKCYLQKQEQQEIIIFCYFGFHWHSGNVKLIRSTRLGRLVDFEVVTLQPGHVDFQ